MFEAEVHTIETPLGTLVLDRNSEDTTRAYVTDPTDDIAVSDREVVRYPSQDFAFVGDEYDAGRILTLVGVLEADTPAEYMPERQRIRGMLNSLRRADGVLRWQPFGMVPMQMSVRRHERPEISARPESGGMLLSLIAGDPRVYSQAITTTIVTAPTAIGGFTSPAVGPIVEEASSTIAVVTNAGDAESWPVVKIFGPIRGPRIVNTTTGLQVSLPGLAIAAGDFLQIDMSAPPTILLNGSVLASRYDYLDAAVSDFWPLVAGGNGIALYGTEYEAGVTRADVLHRDAWMP